MAKHSIRLGLAALVGAIVLFAWAAISHTSLIDGIGFSPLPNEDEVVPVLRASLPEDGLYYYPALDLQETSSADFEAKYRAGPTGLVVHRTGGESPVSAAKLATQFLGDLLAAALAAWLASQIAGGFWRRVAAITASAVFGVLAMSSLFWNWYGFTDAFFLAHAADKVAGWALAGLVIARLVPNSACSTAIGDNYDAGPGCARLG